MAITIDNVSEVVDDRSQSSVSMTQEQGRATGAFHILAQENAGGDYQAFTLAEVQSLPGIILGYNGSASPPGNFKLNRNLPYAHPIFDQLYASGVSGLRGVGQPTKTSNNNDPLNAPALPSLALYPNWEFQIEFTSRPYAVLSDDKIFTVESHWTPPPSDASGSIAFTYAEEWNRYTDINILPQNDYITGVQGHSAFRTQTLAVPQGSIFPGMPKIYLPNSLLTITWYDVPLRYMISVNSYLNKYRGRVNQFAFYDTLDGEKLFDPGELLYLSYTPRTRSNPVVANMPWAGGNVTSTKFMDVQLQFLYTQRTATDVPASTGSANYIAAGHNLNPYFPKRAFYYTVFEDIDDTEAPNWYSFPVELLFTDPDTEQPATQP